MVSRSHLTEKILQLIWGCIDVCIWNDVTNQKSRRRFWNSNESQSNSEKKIKLFKKHFYNMIYDLTNDYAIDHKLLQIKK